MDLIGLIPSIGNVAFTIVAFIAALSVIIAIHEYGHYIVGRWSGIKADVFSIGFGPVLTSRTDKHGTKWQIAALPFGGFVKFRGDQNAASAPEEGALEGLSSDERRATMQGAPLWARAATVAAGPVFNFILSFILFAGLLLWNGLPADPFQIDEQRPHPFVQSELQEGDIILGFNGQRLSEDNTLSQITEGLEPAPSLQYLVERDGAEIEAIGPWFFSTIVGPLTPGWAAAKAGLVEGEVITKFNGEEVFAFSQILDGIRSSEGKPVEFEIWNESGETRTVSLTPQTRDYPAQDGGFETHYFIGMGMAIPFENATVAPTLGEAVKFGGSEIVRVIENSFSALYHIIAGKISTCNLSGPIGIAKISGHTASLGAFDFIAFIALLSTAVGMLNLFPIPVLDGGHLVFHAFEAVTGRPPSDRALKYMMTVGLTLMLSLMVFSVTNDLFCP